MELKNEGAQLLTACGKINILNLKLNQYTISLLQEAFRVELLTQKEINNIQVQIMLILKDLIIRYTKGESSSVTTDTAESLLNSILYSIDAYSLSRGSAEEAVKHLQTIQLEKIYKKGIERVSQWFDETKSLYNSVRKNKLNVQLESYELTIHEAIPLFLKNYGMIFDAHNATASIDYPLVFDDMSIRGVLYIKNYLQHLWIENEFCNYFGEQDIKKLLNNFGRMIKMDYKIELINIFELVFNNVVFSVMSGSTANDLTILRSHFDLINNKLKSLSDDNIGRFIEKAVEKIIHNLNISEPALLDYIYQYKIIFIQRVINAVKNDRLSSIAVTEIQEKVKGGISIFKEGERMSDDSYKQLIKILMKLPGTAEKINLIKENINSIYDFVDILNADCLFGDEFETLFYALGDLELAILAKMVFYEELRDDFASLKFIISQKKYAENEWHKLYIEFIQKLCKDRIDLIENYFSEIEYEEIKFN